jgi:hypothetical protein
MESKRRSLILNTVVVSNGTARCNSHDRSVLFNSYTTAVGGFDWTNIKVMSMVDRRRETLLLAQNILLIGNRLCGGFAL